MTPIVDVARMMIDVVPTVETDTVAASGFDGKLQGSFLAVFLIVHSILVNPKYTFIASN